MIAFFKRVYRIGSRIRGITRFSSAGSSAPDKLKMLVVGYARGHTFSSPGIISHIGRRIFPDITVRPRLLDGLTLRIDPSDLSHLVVTEEVLLDQVYPLIQVPFEPDVILDCGAHIGVFTLLALSRFPKARLVAFEPDPANYRLLEKQVTTNKLQVDLFHGAVSTRNGEAVFEAGRGCGGTLVAEASATAKAITVKTWDLADYVQKLGCQRLLLKLDVEGAEEHVLPAIIDALPFECVIFLETHGGQESWQRLSTLLKHHSFTVAAIRRRELYTDGLAIRTRGNKTR